MEGTVMVSTGQVIAIWSAGMSSHLIFPVPSILYADSNECAEATAGCNQRCMNTPGNYTCACYHGYTLSTANRHTCLGEYLMCIDYPSLQGTVLRRLCLFHADVDECSTGNGGCGHTCNNTIGFYYCSCDPGYRLGDNRHRCHSE